VELHSHGILTKLIFSFHLCSPNAAVEQCPKGICLELLVLPAAERRGNQEFAAQLPHSPRAERGENGASAGAPGDPLQAVVGLCRSNSCKRDGHQKALSALTDTIGDPLKFVEVLAV
jgi:hypothetical protein